MSLFDAIDEKIAPVLGRVPSTSLIVILPLVWMMVIGLLLGLWIMPLWRVWSDADAAQTVLEAQTALPVSALGDPARLRAEIATMAQQLESVPHGMTGGAVAIEKIRQSAVAAGFSHVEVKLTGGATGSTREPLRLAVDLSGSYVRVGNWLERLPLELPWLELRRIELSRGGNGVFVSGGVTLQLQGILLPDLQNPKPGL